MGTAKQMIRRAALLLALFHLAPGIVSGETTTERSGSVLIFPKVVFGPSRDTMIQITNTSNSMVHAHCFYLNNVPECTGQGSCLDDTCNAQCIPSWIEIDFDIWLTKQQPTSWTAGFGRIARNDDPYCYNARIVGGESNFDCYGAGIDPGRIPPTADPFVGELKCIEVDPSGAPISGNHLKGEATIVDPTTGDASKHNAIGILGLDSNNGDNTLCLGGQVGESCPSGAEYGACPAELVIDHFAENADSELFGPTSTVRSRLTLMPCTQNFETQRPTAVTVQFEITNEFEQVFSASTTVNCWEDFELEEINPIFTLSFVGTRVLQTRVRPASGSQSGVIGVLEEEHTLSGRTTRAAFDLHQEGNRTQTDFIVIPEGP